MTVEIKECGCLVDEVCDPGFNEWAGVPLDTVFVQTTFCKTHKGTVEIKEETEAYKL
jgi:hypothetical protein